MYCLLGVVITWAKDDAWEVWLVGRIRKMLGLQAETVSLGINTATLSSE